MKPVFFPTSTILVLLAVLLVACEAFDSPEERALSEAAEEWLKEGKCWFKGEALDLVIDIAGASYSVQPIPIPSEPFRVTERTLSPRTHSLFAPSPTPGPNAEPNSDSCTFESDEDVSPWASVQNVWTSIQAGDYYFRIHRIPTGDSGNLPQSNKFWIGRCLVSVNGEPCSGTPTWEVHTGR